MLNIICYVFKEIILLFYISIIALVIIVNVLVIAHVTEYVRNFEFYWCLHRTHLGTSITVIDNVVKYSLRQTRFKSCN